MAGTAFSVAARMTIAEPGRSARVLGDHRTGEHGQLGDQRAGDGRRRRAWRRAGSPSHARRRAAHGVVDAPSTLASPFQRLEQPATLCAEGKVRRFSRGVAPIISMICRRRATRSANSRSPRRARGGSGLAASAKRAITAASIGSVSARVRAAWAKDRICAGSTTSPGQTRPRQSRCQPMVSKPPVASSATMWGATCSNRAARRSSRPHRAPPKRLSARTNSDVEPILRYVNADGDHVHGDPPR